MKIKRSNGGIYKRRHRTVPCHSYGEIILHIDGYIAWDFFDSEDTENFLYKSCHKIDLEIKDGKVYEERFYVKHPSNMIGKMTYWFF